LDRDLGDKRKARRHYEEALKIYGPLAQQDPSGYHRYLARTLNDLGVLDLRQTRRGEARQNLERALTIRRQLAHENPDAFQPDLADTLNNLGDLDEAQKRVEAARSDYQQALDIYKGISERDPNKYAAEKAKVECVRPANTMADGSGRSVIGYFDILVA
jgi:tetratricopeptide (TPR) repeat protein